MVLTAYVPLSYRDYMKAYVGYHNCKIRAMIGEEKLWMPKMF